MHEGFSGGAFLNTAGELIGVNTATDIRGLRVVIPASIAWQTAATLLEHGQLKRGYLGIAGHPVTLPPHQRATVGRDHALLVAGVTADSPAAAAGVLVGDLLCELDGRPVASPEDLLDLLAGDRIGRQATLRIARGGSVVDVSVTVGERPTN
jgi:S1-C subfamily serine protease